jgi:hypothetical protein
LVLEESVAEAVFDVAAPKASVVVASLEAAVAVEVLTRVVVAAEL